MTAGWVRLLVHSGGKPTKANAVVKEQIAYSRSRVRDLQFAPRGLNVLEKAGLTVNAGATREP